MHEPREERLVFREGDVQHGTTRLFAKALRLGLRNDGRVRFTKCQKANSSDHHAKDGRKPKGPWPLAGPPGLDDPRCK